MVQLILMMLTILIQLLIKDSTTAGADAALTLNENLTTAMQSKLHY